MSVRKESPPEEEKPRKPVTKTKPTARKTPAAKKPATKKAPVKKTPTKTPAKAPTKAAPKKTTPKKATEKKATPKTPAAKNDNPQADGSKKKLNRKPSPVNGNVLPEGRPFQAGDQAREAGRKGGIKSAAIKKARKTFREEMLELLQVTSPDSDGKPHTQQELILAAMIKEARGGNVKAYEAVQSTIGEKQQERLEVAVALPQFDTLDAAFSGMGGDAQ